MGPVATGCPATLAARAQAAADGDLAAGTKVYILTWKTTASDSGTTISARLTLTDARSGRLLVRAADQRAPKGPGMPKGPGEGQPEAI
jgi:hypothetical protein